MARYTRHQLKEDKFTETAAESLSWMREHQGKLTTVLVIVLIALLGAGAAWFYLQRSEQQASLELSKALRTYETPLREPGTPPNPQFESFASDKERAEAARKQFKEIAEKYKYTRSGEAARYLEGVAAISAGDSKAAEQRLKDLASGRNKDLASLAKMKLASLYRTSNRDDEAIAIYRDLAEHPTRSVTKEMTQLELAAALEAKNPTEAQRIYEALKAENPSSPAAQVATERQRKK
ncbi:MAG: tetratricopeptide repeat protein [Acidobacteriales bacterium]|nr:tetratricopeptide repeat protein [Terriglobales bacterium]